MSQHVRYLVVDSGAFIKNSPVHEYAENVFTVNGAVKEIKDKATLQRLQVLPYTLHVKEPSPDACKHVSDFAKKTGDYGSLSTVDLQVAALTYQLHLEHASSELLNTQPRTRMTKKPVSDSSQLLGFYYPKKKVSDKSSPHQEKDKDEMSANSTENSDEKDSEDPENDEGIQDEDDCCDDSDDEEGWVTAKDLQDQIDALSLDRRSPLTVACVTTDFAIQNVLLQMGLHVVSVDGMIIKQTRVYILRCFSCFRTTNVVTKKFCPNCGNKTLKRVGVTVNEDGSKNVHINFRRPINIRGTRYSLPTPKGGKHSTNPLVCEDQPIPQNRPVKSHLQDVLSPEFDVNSSPFAVNDIYSRAASLGIRRGGLPQHTRRNPNEWSKKTGNKKRK